MDHLSNYLDYYRKLKEPEFAVLVTGCWGSGKTYQVQSKLPKEDRYYVSLFGLRTADEAHAAIYAVYDPKLAKAKAVFRASGGSAENSIGLASLLGVSDAMKGLVSLASMANELSNAVLKRQIRPDRVLVLDDLERCSMGLEEMMGVISHYVEHRKFRVVLVADEEKLLQKEPGFESAKEKIVGHTAKVSPNRSEAFDAFANGLQGEGAKAWIKSQKALVLDVFDQSGCMSLRILRHLILDLFRLFETLEQRHFDNQAAMTEVVRIFVAIEIEIRLGQLKPNDLKNRLRQIMAGQMKEKSGNKENETEKNTLFETNKKYQSIDFSSNLLNDRVLVDIFEYGVFNAEQIRYSLNESGKFSDWADAPAWKRVWNYYQLEDEQLQKALDEMNRQFDGREITSSGELLHTFALRLMMADEGIYSGDIEATKIECLKYIDDLVAAGKLPPRELDWEWPSRLYEYHDGYGYRVEDSYRSQFDEIQNKLISARQSALQVTYPDIVADLLQILNEDGIEFYRQLCHTEGHDSPYAGIPVLSGVSAKNFVDAWLAAPKSERRWVKHALNERSTQYIHDRDWDEERNWALEVLHELEKRRDEATGFEKLRISRIFPDKIRQLRNEDAQEPVGD